MVVWPRVNRQLKGSWAALRAQPKGGGLATPTFWKGPTAAEKPKVYDSRPAQNINSYIHKSFPNRTNSQYSELTLLQTYTRDCELTGPTGVHRHDMASEWV